MHSFMYEQYFYIFSSGDTNKDHYANSKQELQDQFREKLNLRVYLPNPHGGNSNTGAVAKKAFANPKIFSEITGCPVDIIEDLGVLLTAMRCGRKLSPEYYQILADDWLQRFHSNPDLDWNWMSPTVHAIVVHGPDLIRVLPCAPGLSTEEVGEANNKVDSRCFSNASSKVHK